MPATFIQIGEPAHDAERQALRFLVEGLPSSYTVYGNAWLVERSGSIYEIDAVVVAPHAVFCVECKSYRGAIEGTDHDWYIPYPIRSPIKLNRITAQVLKDRLKRESHAAGQLRTEGFVFLSQTTNVGVRGPASKDRVHTKKTILAALQDRALIERLSGWRTLPSTSLAEREILRVLTGVVGKPRPVRRIREYEVVRTIDHQDSFTELLAKNSLTPSIERVLRVYSFPPLAPEAQRERITERARWEAQVLGRLGKSEGILSADPPFSDEAGIVLPFEHFANGITLTTWIDRYGPDAKNKAVRADLYARTDLWIRIAATLDEAHRQGVVHRLLRPEIILVEDEPHPEEVRITGFDLAKQLAVDTTIALTTIQDERLVYAAPEVVTAFSSAEPASDQFSLGAILAMLLTGRPLFHHTRELLAAGRLVRRVRDMHPSIPLSLDEAVTKMIALRPPDRFASLADAVEAVKVGRDPESKAQQHLPIAPRPTLDVDNLEKGDRVGTDYEIVARLGQGGMAVVYAAHHLVSGRTRALKIAHETTIAEEALRSEYKVLDQLDHPTIVRVKDLTKMVEGRFTLVMERVGEDNLRQWLKKTPTPDPPTQRRLAEDLLSGLDYLEQQGVTHKDLKPDNLLVHDGRLTIIDFSLAAIPEDAPYGGTALYRDPASARWTHATDRFAAALCLFELYAGRHAFDGRVPEPNEGPHVSEADIDPPGLAAFFLKALAPEPARRFPSARAMREALLVALGEDATTPASVPPAAQIDVTTPIRLTGLSSRAINALTRSQVADVDGLLAFTPSQIRAIHAIGTKTAREVIARREELLARGLVSTGATKALVEPPLVPDLADSPEPVHALALSDALRTALAKAGLPTVGAVAGLTRGALLRVPGIGRKKLSDVVEALHRFDEQSHDRDAAPSEHAHTLDRMWELAARPLSDAQRLAVERAVGITGEPESQGQIAEDLKQSQPQISLDLSKGIERLDLGALAQVSDALETVLDGFRGIVRLDKLGARFEEEWPAGVVRGAGLVRLLVRLAGGRAHLVEVGGADQPLVARPHFDAETLRAFAAEVVRIASQWPPVEPKSAWRTLSGLLPTYQGDPVELGIRLCDDVQLAQTGHLFIPPLEAKDSLAFVLDQTRDRITLDELERRVRRIFGDGTHFPEPDRLLGVLHELDCRVQGNDVVPGGGGSLAPEPGLPADALPATLGSERSPEEVVRDMLGTAARSRGFRMLITPPEHHREIGRSVASALAGATWLSFEDAFFTDHAADIAMLERAERFIAQRDALTEAAESTLFRLLDEHGAPNNVLVLGDTALLGLCDALDLPRRLYDETLSGSRGFWVLVVPGVIHKRQPRFNEGPAMWHLEGATLPVSRELPQGPSPSGGGGA